MTLRITEDQLRGRRIGSCNRELNRFVRGQGSKREKVLNQSLYRLQGFLNLWSRERKREREMAEWSQGIVGNRYNLACLSRL